MTNRVYRVDLDGRSVCLRIPGSGAAAAVDRRAEEVNARLAAKAGVAPEVLYFGDDGVMLTRFIEDAVPLRPERIRASEGALERGAIALRRLHEADIAFASTFRAFETIDAYAAALQRLGMPPSEPSRAAIRRMQAIGSALAAHPVAPRPCHCDPTGRNLLDTGEKVWLVDWEYSGMNDPMWDLAYFSIESLLDEAGDRALLTAYFGHAPEEEEAARMAVLKPVCEVQAALWALIQVAEGKTGRRFFRLCEGDVRARSGADACGGFRGASRRRCGRAETGASRGVIVNRRATPPLAPPRKGEGNRAAIHARTLPARPARTPRSRSARRAAAIPMQYFRSPIAVEDKPDESPVTIADRETEAHIRRAIEKRFPAHDILGEEFGRSGSDADYTWIIDPIDGTRSFICGIPLFGMLLGVLARRRSRSPA